MPAMRGCQPSRFILYIPVVRNIIQLGLVSRLTYIIGSEVRLWSFAVGEPGQFRMLRVDKCYIPKDIDEQAETLGYLRFFWDLRVSIIMTRSSIDS